MKLRNSVCRFGFLAAALCWGAALAQSGTSPVGTWRSDMIEKPPSGGLARVNDTVELTVSKVEADQRVSGNFVAFETNWGMPTVPGCRRGPVSGTFDGTALKLVTQATSLCPERVFDLRVEDEKLTGKYKREVVGFLDVTFTRKP
ncbi:MAG: hypothetical protein NDJ19_04370 [Ramlibacter sp.]|nr:hypothetical protein [Ramlibacter sp.]